MSRSKPTGNGSSNPIKFYFSFSGETGKIKHYNKETKTNEELDELEFIVLDTRSSITGWNEQDKSSIYSNLVSSLKEEPLTVKTSKRTIATGFYDTTKDKNGNIISPFVNNVTSDSVGGKFTSNLLILAKMGKEWELGNLQLTGSGIGSWISFTTDKDQDGKPLGNGKPDVNGSIITITVGESRKKGRINYVIPAFTVEPITEKLDGLAMEQDILLQEYFDSLKPTDSESPKPSTKPSPKKDEVEEEEDDLPF